MSGYTKNTLVQQTTAAYIERQFDRGSLVARRPFLSLGRTKGCNQPINNLQSDAIGLTIGHHENR